MLRLTILHANQANRLVTILAIPPYIDWRCHLISTTGDAAINQQLAKLSYKNHEIKSKSLLLLCQTTGDITLGYIYQLVMPHYINNWRCHLLSTILLAMPPYNNWWCSLISTTGGATFYQQLLMPLYIDLWRCRPHIKTGDAAPQTIMPMSPPYLRNGDAAKQQINMYDLNQNLHCHNLGTKIYF